MEINETLLTSVGAHVEFVAHGVVIAGQSCSRDTDGLLIVDVPDDDDLPRGMAGEHHVMAEDIERVDYNF